MPIGFRIVFRSDSSGSFVLPIFSPTRVRRIREDRLTALPQAQPPIPPQPQVPPRAKVPRFPTRQPFPRGVAANDPVFTRIGRGLIRKLGALAGIVLSGIDLANLFQESILSENQRQLEQILARERQRRADAQEPRTVIVDDPLGTEGQTTLPERPARPEIPDFPDEIRLPGGSDFPIILPRIPAPVPDIVVDPQPNPALPDIIFTPNPSLPGPLPSIPTPTRVQPLIRPTIDPLPFAFPTPGPVASPLADPIPSLPPGDLFPLTPPNPLGVVSPLNFAGIDPTAQPQTNARRCEVVKRRRRKKGKCREGFFRERPGETEFVTWRENNCL